MISFSVRSETVGYFLVREKKYPFEQNKTWQAGDYANSPVMAGYSSHFTIEGQDPSVWDYSEKIYLLTKVEPCGGGALIAIYGKY